MFKFFTNTLFTNNLAVSDYFIFVIVLSSSDFKRNQHRILCKHYIEIEFTLRELSELLLTIKRKTVI